MTPITQPEADKRERVPILIQLTTDHGKVVYWNPNHIMFIRSGGESGAWIVTASGEYLVSEQPDKVAAMLEESLRAIGTLKP